MKLRLFVILSFFSFPSFADHIVNVKIKGMVCSYCSSGVKKKFLKQEEVGKVDVDMDKQQVSVEFKENKNLDDKKITEIISGLGFNVAEINRAH